MDAQRGSHDGAEGREGGYLVVVAEPVVAHIGDNDTGFFRLDGCVWEILW